MTITVTTIHTHEQVCALAPAVRDGKLSPEQREQLARLLHRMDSAYGLAPLAAQRYPTARNGVTPTWPRAGNWSAPRTASYSRP